MLGHGICILSRIGRATCHQVYQTTHSWQSAKQNFQPSIIVFKKINKWTADATFQHDQNFVFSAFHQILYLLLNNLKAEAEYFSWKLQMDLGESRGRFRKRIENNSTPGLEEKPCRACSDFQKWVPTKDSRETKKHLECPPDKNELGNSSWKFLHTMSVYLPESGLSNDLQSDLKKFMFTFSNIYPCEYCAEDMRKDLKESPPKVSTGKEFAEWLCQLHNKVNVKLEKPVFDCSLVYERWRDGWRDGSCDPK